MKNNRFLNLKELIICSIFAATIAIGGFIKIPIPIVPFTLQFLFTTLAGLILGKKLGSISVLIYILIGLAGVPVFAEGGGIGYIFRPTFGYIIGFLVGTYVTGSIAEKSDRMGFKNLLKGSFAGLAVVYLFGMVYYYFISKYYMNSEIGIWTLFLYCFLLAVPGDIGICYVSSIIAKKINIATKGGCYGFFK